MDDWRIIRLLVLLAALLPAGTLKRWGGRRHLVGTGGSAGRTVLIREHGQKKFGFDFDLAAVSVAAR
ncbi:MAG: hypothetical protein K6T66_13350 [Peptococcaceae bacterium]|nr:hypothetical protein [Peptococcaceae bacterium]